MLARERSCSRRRKGNRHQLSASRPDRDRQNLSFVIRPSSRCSRPWSTAGGSRMRIPTMSAGHSEPKSATCSDPSRPAVPIDVGRGGGSPAGRWW